MPYALKSLQQNIEQIWWIHWYPDPQIGNARHSYTPPVGLFIFFGIYFRMQCYRGSCLALE
jgi:hypothetical protein